MSANTEDSLRKHLDAVDRIERRFKRKLAFAAGCRASSATALSSICQRRRRTFANARLRRRDVGDGHGAAATGLHYRIAQMTNTILKAIELSSRERQ